jgi:hypothetical protein
MAADDPTNAGDAGAPAPAAQNGGGGGQVALLSDPVDVIIDKLLRCVVATNSPQKLHGIICFAAMENYCFFASLSRLNRFYGG